jgi:hypothetical protein
MANLADDRPEIDITAAVASDQNHITLVIPKDCI